MGSLGQLHLAGHNCRDDLCGRAAQAARLPQPPNDATSTLTDCIADRITDFFANRIADLIADFIANSITDCIADRRNSPLAAAA